VSGIVQRLAFATGVPLDIYAFHCYTENSSLPSILKPDSIQCSFRVELEDFTPNLPATYAPFTPSESEQRLGPLYYRGCWHRVSRPFLFRYYQLTTY
jgi:hypothetical protein